MAADIKFYRGSKPLDLTSITDQNAIYFFTDSQEIYMGGKIFGASVETIEAIQADIAALEAVDAQHNAAIKTLEDWKAEAAAAISANTEAAKGAQDAADAAQKEVDDLEAYVGVIPSGYAEETVIAYINKKAEETLASASGGSSESAASVLAALNTYKAENDPKVSANATGVSEAKAAAQAAQEAAEAAQADIDAFMAAADVSENAIDTLKEIQDYITSEGEAAAELLAKIEANEEAIDAIEGDYLKAADKTDLMDAINLKASSEDLAEVAGKVTSVEGDIGTINSEITAIKENVAANAAAAKQAQDEVDALEEIVAGKADATAVTALDGRVAAAEGKITTLEATAHAHENKAVLDGISSAKVSSWDSAEQNAKNYADSLLTWNAL